MIKAIRDKYGETASFYYISNILKRNHKTIIYSFKVANDVVTVDRESKSLYQKYIDAI